MVTKCLVYIHTYTPRTEKAQESITESERTGEGPLCFRDSGAKGRKVEMRDRARRASQATKDREARLQQRRPQYRLAAETAKEREARLQPRRDRLVAETAKEREARLQPRRDRLVAETADEREARLQQMRVRLAAEIPEQREARLQQMSTYQHERLAAYAFAANLCNWCCL